MRDDKSINLFVKFLKIQFKISFLKQLFAISKKLSKFINNYQNNEIVCAAIYAIMDLKHEAAVLQNCSIKC